MVLEVAVATVCTAGYAFADTDGCLVVNEVRAKKSQNQREVRAKKSQNYSKVRVDFSQVVLYNTHHEKE